jgi:hypothetical protein
MGCSSSNSNTVSRPPQGLAEKNGSISSKKSSWSNTNSNIRRELHTEAPPSGEKFLHAEAVVKEKLSQTGLSGTKQCMVSWNTESLDAANPLTNLEVKISPDSEIGPIRIRLNADKIFGQRDPTMSISSMRLGAKTKIKVSSDRIPAEILEKVNSASSLVLNQPSPDSRTKKKTIGFSMASASIPLTAEFTPQRDPPSESRPALATSRSARFNPGAVSPPSRPLFTRGSLLGKMKSVRSPSDRADLIVLGHEHYEGDDEEVVDIIKHDCDICHMDKEKGVFCDSLDHFICSSCFATHVETLCRDTKTFKTSKSAVSCPCGGCTSAPWNSYHMRKILTNGHDSVLELYLSTMMTLMQELSFARVAGPTPSPLKRGFSVGSPIVSRQSSNRQPDATTDPPLLPFTPDTITIEPSNISINIQPPIVHGVVAPQSAKLSPPPAVAPPLQPIIIQFSDEELQFEFEKLKETIKILRKQLQDHNIDAAEYIPLEIIQQELQQLFGKANRGEPYDEGRMDYLLMCLENNPDYIAKKEEEQRQWREEILAYANTCYEEMLSYVPPDIFSASIVRLREEYKFSTEFAKRLMQKKCLWLIRCEPSDIEKLHEADLMGRFTFEAQGLDIIELAALFAAVPEKFSSDSTGRKQNWRNNLEFSLKKLLSDKAQGRLEKVKIRNPAYGKETPKFAGDRRLHRLRDDTGAQLLSNSSYGSFMTKSSEFKMINSQLSSESLAEISPFSAVSPDIKSVESLIVSTDLHDELPQVFKSTVLHPEAVDRTVPVSHSSSDPVSSMQPILNSSMENKFANTLSEAKSSELESSIPTVLSTQSSSEDIPPYTDKISNEVPSDVVTNSNENLRTLSLPSKATQSSLAVAAAAAAAKMAARRRASVDDQPQKEN